MEMRGYAVRPRVYPAARTILLKSLCSPRIGCKSLGVAMRSMGRAHPNLRRGRVRKSVEELDDILVLEAAHQQDLALELKLNLQDECLTACQEECVRAAQAACPPFPAHSQPDRPFAKCKVTPFFIHNTYTHI